MIVLTEEIKKEAAVVEVRNALNEDVEVKAESANRGTEKETVVVIGIAPGIVVTKINMKVSFLKNCLSCVLIIEFLFTGAFDNEYSEQKVATHNYNDGDSGYSSRRNRSRSRERKRYVRSRSRSGSRERKRSRSTYVKSENNGTTIEKDRHGSQFANYDAGAESGEIEEGEDTEYRRPFGNNNGQSFKTEEYDDEYQDSYNQPAYVAYNTKDD